MAEETKGSAEVYSRFVEMKHQSQDLSRLVSSESERLRIPFESTRAPEKLTAEESKKIVLHDFNKRPDLQLSVEVNLGDSKSAFRAFLKGISDGSTFDNMWNLRAHDPLAYPHPISGIDRKVLGLPETAPHGE